MGVGVVRWLLNPGQDVWLVYRSVQVVWMGTLTVWSLIIRIALRRGLLMPEAPRLLLLATPEEQPSIQKAWSRVSPPQLLEPISPTALDQLLKVTASPLLVVLSPDRLRDPGLSSLVQRLEIRDDHLLQTISVISLFEQQQERLPPALLEESAFSYEHLPLAMPFSIQVQLKRLADLLVAVALLLITVPFIGLASILIWLEDRGPVLYSQ